MTPIIRIADLHYAFPDGTPALKGVTLEIRRGSKVAIMGPNGAGKSTLLLHLNAIHLPQRGLVEVGGLDSAHDTEDAIRRRVGLVFQDPDDQVFSTTVWEDVCFGPLNLGLSEAETAARAEESLRAVGMLELRDRSPQRLSYGQKKRAAVAGVLAMGPDVLVLDEPMAYLDPEGQEGLTEILSRLHSQGKTLIVATHDVDWAAEWADEVLLLRDGRVLAGGPPSLLADEETVRQAGLRLPRVVQFLRDTHRG